MQTFPTAESVQQKVLSSGLLHAKKERKKNPFFSDRFPAHRGWRVQNTKLFIWSGPLFGPLSARARAFALHSSSVRPLNHKRIKGSLARPPHTTCVYKKMGKYDFECAGLVKTICVLPEGPRLDSVRHTLKTCTI